MITLYAIPVSLYCAKVRIVLRHKHLDWEEVTPPGGYGSDKYKAMVPAGNLPALDHDGLLIADSEAIGEYLNEVFPEPDMLPGSASQRAKLRELSRFHDTRLEPALRALFPHIAKQGQKSSELQSLWDLTASRLEQAAPLLDLTHRSLSLADCGYAISLVWIDQLATHFDLDSCVNEDVRDYHAQLLSQRAVAEELVHYQPRLESWLATK
ncbi:MAG: glutathione S-transferase family protein [Rhizobiaceae bacterium]